MAQRTMKLSSEQPVFTEVVFTNGYTAAANCAPSRASLMTGLWPTRHGIYTVGSRKRQ